MHICLFSTIVRGFGQFTPKTEYLHADANMIMNVKQFGQFIKRFNYEEDFDGNEIGPDFMSKVPRNEYIGLLFNVKDTRFNPSATGNLEYSKLVDEFIEFVCNGTHLIAGNSQNIYVLANCEISTHGKNTLLDLVLKRSIRNGGACWEIANVLNIDKIVPNDENPGNINFIAPTSNEVNFTHLKRVFDDKENFEEYLDAGYRNDPLTRLKNEVQSGSIEFHHVSKMSYFIFDVEGWAITVDEYIRDDINSGWLVSNLEKWNDSPMDYIKNAQKR